MSERALENGRHRFFRTMVLMGGGIALGCGGVSDGRRAGTDASAKESDDAGSGGGASREGGASGGSGGTTPGKGGATSAGAGGTSPGTGGSSSGSGGSAGDASKACSPSQWTCAAIPLCVSPFGYALPENCTCDETRPLSGDDCPSGRRVCLSGTAAPDGTALPTQVPVECSCAPEPTDCVHACRETFPDGDGHDCEPVGPSIPATPPGDDILCGCAWVYLR